jgi:CCR4-NOT transcription complex subunit 1
LVKLDYTYIDLISRMVTVLLKTMVSTLPKNRINLLEKILTAIILVMTKEHYHNNEKFNSKLFFKLFFNILYDLNWPGYDFQDNLKEMLMTIVQALHILQPIKYPSFSFAWLQLVSSKYLMAPLLRDVS